MYTIFLFKNEIEIGTDYCENIENVVHHGNFVDLTIPDLMDRYQNRIVDVFHHQLTPKQQKYK